MNKRKFIYNGAAALMLAAIAFTTPSCALMRGEMNQGDVALLALDLQDVAREGTIYALAKQPEWEANIVLVRDQLNALSALPDQPTFDALLRIMQGLPFEELQSPEARLAFTAASMTLRRVGRNVNLGNITNIRPLINGISAGMTQALTGPRLPSAWSPVPEPSKGVAVSW